MILSLINHSFRYEIENVLRIFFPLEKITVIDDLPDTNENYVVTIFREKDNPDGNDTAVCSASIGGKNGSVSKSVSCEEKNQRELLIAQCLYELLVKITDYTPSWGILTGVRPSKLMRSRIEKNGEEAAYNHFKENLYVSDEKIKLAASVAKAENKIISLSQDNSYSLYISIPFCPTRCSYCSFVSHSITQAKKLIPDYVRLLCVEISEFSKIARDLGLKLETVYFGGGTPTSLDDESLKAVTDVVGKCFDIKNIREYTIEAGRPDTLTDEKLEIMKNAGVTRISINPQSFNDSVLKNIGRNHSSEDTLNAFDTARKHGFDNINMDLIAGLPGDTYDGFCDSVSKAAELSPENITVHTLALKRASRIVTDKNQNSVSLETAKMLSFASEKLYSEKYSPYYMYRQSKSVGNLENVGWTKKDMECLYNIYMMEEVHTVFAAGGGAVTKLKAPHENRIERIFNFKYPYEYISRYDELTKRKKHIYEFYSEL
ncbi:MAG: coproporphyrinogen dehydrogenase HemZ [Clostridiales bacterium]|nr:coproporphyrinogen dehydrogenase HemZ [Clostridiales bacterium]